MNLLYNNKFQYNSKLQFAFLIILLSLITMVLSNESASGEIDGFSSLDKEVSSIIKENEENVSVYIETKEGIIEFNESDVMSSASIIKIPILVEAIKQAEQGKLVWGDEVIVEESDIVRGSGTLKDEDIPLSSTVKDLADLMITVSDNTATNMIMERVGFDSVNWTCIQMGCEDTVLQNSIYTSMPQDRGPHNYTTAKDIGIILKETYEGDTISSAGKEEFFDIMSSYDGSRLPGNQDSDKHGDIQIAHKGGSTANPRVRHDGAIFRMGDDGETVYAAVLTNELTGDIADPMMAEIGEAIMNYMVKEN